MRKLWIAAALFLGVAGTIPFAPAASAACDATFPAVQVGVDQTAALQATINGAPDGTVGDRTVICFPSKTKTYRVEGKIAISGRNHLQILGNSNKFNRTVLQGDIDPSAKTEWVQQIEIESSADILIDKVKTQSVGTCSFDTNFEGEAAVKIGGSVDVTLTGMVIAGPAGDGYSFGWHQTPGSQQAGTPSERISVSGGSVTCVGRQGVGISSNTYDSIVSGVTFDQVARSILDMEMAGSDALLELHNFTFTGNTALHTNINFVAGGGGGVHHDVYITSNTVESLKGKYGNSDNDVDRFNFVFSGNVATAAFNTNAVLLSFKGVDGVTVQNNVQTILQGTPTSYVICTNVSESGNSWN